MDNKICKVCGFIFDEFYPWGEDGKSPSFDICSCCGTEFGYHDFTIKGIKAQRERWKLNGYKWKYEEDKPIGWNLEKQLVQIPDEYK